MRYVAAHKPIALKATLTQGLVQKVKFEIADKAGKKIAESEEILLADGQAEWSWTPNTDAAKILPDEEDIIEVGSRIFWFNPDGSGAGEYVPLEDITVFRDEIKIKVKSDADAAVTDANVRIVVERPGNHKKSQKLSAEPATAEGEVTFSGIHRWSAIEVIVSGAWVLQNAAAPWKQGKEKGLNREIVVVVKKYKAAFKGIARQGSSDFAPIKEVGETRIQYVNFNNDQKLPPLGQDETEAHYCHTVRIRIGPEDSPSEFANELIYLKFEAGENNSKRNDPKPGLTGQGAQPDATGILALRLNTEGVADCDLELGCAGGDTFTLKANSVKDFSGTVDQTLTFQNWRKLFYELMAPMAMTPALSNVTLPESAGSGPHYDLSTSVRDSLKKVLDPVFIKYELSKSHIFANNQVKHPSQLQPAAFLKRGDARDLYLASPDSIKPRSADFSHPREPHTVHIHLCDVYYNDTINEVASAMILKNRESEVHPPDAGRHFLPDQHASLPAHEQPSITWEAVMTNPATYPNHPGLDHSGKPLKGTLPGTVLIAKDHNTIQLKLAAGSVPGSLVGEESATNCRAMVRFKLRDRRFDGGMLCSQSPLTASDCTSAFMFGHQLGHAMNMTITNANDVPPGLDMPKNVDEEGTYFREAKDGETPCKDGKTTGCVKGLRAPGKGKHCATGLTDKAAATYPTTFPQGGCLMYPYGPATAPAEPILFCTVCTEYVKALDLRKLP